MGSLVRATENAHLGMQKVLILHPNGIMTKTISALLALFLASACGVKNNIAGTYQLERFPKTILTINSDSTFEFSKNHPNPYLHPSDHPDQYYWNTKGKWTMAGKKTLLLTSQTDTMIYPLVTINELPAENKDRSCFTFYDTYGDRVNVVYTKLSDNSWVGRLHGTSPFFWEDLTKKDTFEFHFYGYRPYTFISGKKVNLDYHIILKPEFQPGYFKGTRFNVKRNRVTDIQRKGKFWRKK